MNNSANNMTFCDTCVVDKMVVTHFRNPDFGTASSANGGNGEGGFVTGASATLSNTKVDSNQNKQVIYRAVSSCLMHTERTGCANQPEQRNLQD